MTQFLGEVYATDSEQRIIDQVVTFDVQGIL